MGGSFNSAPVMNNLLRLVASILLAAQPSLAARQTQPNHQPARTQAAQPAPRTAADAQTQTVAVEELLPADTVAFVATSNLAGLLENFRRLDAVKTLEARLPKSERDGADSPLTEALRYLSFGIEDARALEDTRLGFALFKPAEQPAPERAPGFVPENETRLRVEAELQGEMKVEGAQSVPAPDPLFVAFVEASDLKSAQKAREQFINFYSDSFAELGKLSEVKQTAHRGATVDRFKNGYLGVMLGATYVIGEQGAVEAVLDLRGSRDAARLSDDADFARSRSQLATPVGLFAYLNGKPLAELVGPALSQVARAMGPMEFLFSDVQALQSAALSSTFDRDGVVDRLALNFDQSKPSLIRTVFSGPQGEAKAARLIPAGTPILWSHSVDWPTVYDNLIVPMVFRSMAQAELMRGAQAETTAEEKEWEKQQAEWGKKAEEAAANNQEPPPPPQMPETMLRRLQQQPDPQKLDEATQNVIARYEKDLGYKLRDELAKDFAGELTVAYGIPNQRGTVGRPRDAFATLIAVRDREAARAALLRLIAYTVMGNLQAMMGGQGTVAAGGAPQPDEKEKQKQFDAAAAVEMALKLVARETYKKAEIISLMSFAAIAFADEYVIVADSADTVKQLLDTPETGLSMLTDSNYRRATGGASSTVSQLFVAPRYFDEMLDGFVRNWSGQQIVEASAAAFPLSVPAMVAATVESTDRGLRVEAFSPLGVPGLVALEMFGSRVRARTNVNEYDARYALRQLAKAEQAYAKSHGGRYAALDALAKEKFEGVKYDFARLKAKDQPYTYELKLKAEGKGFEATATPARYGRQGRLSFFVDETGKIRRADKSGAPATAADEADESPLKHPEKEGDDEDEDDDKENRVSRR
jgi:hypothetical protein